MTATMSDLSALTAPDYAGDFVNAFKIGEGLAAPSGPSGPALDQFTNAVTSRLQVPDGPLRDQAARRAELLGALGVGLSGLPYPQRIPILNHLAPVLAQEGIPAHVAIGFDPIDEALASSVAQAQTAGDSLNR